MPERIVHCRLLKKDLPGLDRAPFRNELGQRIFEEVSKDAWQMWLKDSVKFINTYRVDLGLVGGAEVHGQAVRHLLRLRAGRGGANGVRPCRGRQERVIRCALRAGQGRSSRTQHSECEFYDVSSIATESVDNSI